MFWTFGQFQSAILSFHVRNGAEEKAPHHDNYKDTGMLKLHFLFLLGLRNIYNSSFLHPEGSEPDIPLRHLKGNPCVCSEFCHGMEVEHLQLLLS